MTKTEARTIIEEQMGVKIMDDQLLITTKLPQSPLPFRSFESVVWAGGSTMFLDGNFTAEQLQALLCWMHEPSNKGYA